MKSFLEGSYDLNLTHFAIFKNFGLVKVRVLRAGITKVKSGASKFMVGNRVYHQSKACEILQWECYLGILTYCHRRSPKVT